jgi:hypothetical protein
VINLLETRSCPATTRYRDPDLWAQPTHPDPKTTFQYGETLVGLQLRPADQRRGANMNEPEATQLPSAAPIATEIWLRPPCQWRDTAPRGVENIKAIGENACAAATS